MSDSSLAPKTLGEGVPSMKEVLLDLANRCEREEPSRELDCRIWAEINDYAVRVVKNQLIGRNRQAPHDECLIGWADKRPIHTLDITFDKTFVARFTTSLDAAVTLVPEAWEWQTSNRAPKPHAGRAYIHNRELIFAGMSGRTRNPKYRSAECTALTPALALCAAALRARAGA